MKKVTAIIERSSEGLYSAYASGLKKVALNGQGDSVNEAIADMNAALEEIMEMYKEEGLELPSELSKGIEFEYKYDIPSLFNFFEVINVSAFAKQVGMNASLLRQYRIGKAFASQKQLNKIRHGLKELGAQLSSAQL